MASEKTKVIEHIFNERFDDEGRVLSNPMVTMQDIRDAIDATGADLKKDNPANFFKDIVRSRRRNENFPDSVFRRGYTAQQAIGEERVFMFVPVPEDQVEPFADIEPSADAIENIIVVQSLTLPLPSRRLGRSDESWLTQVVARLNILQAHLSTRSDTNLVALELLITNAKLGSGEIDAVFIGAEETEAGYRDVLISAEMKSVKEVLEPEQVLRGAEALRRNATKILESDDFVVIPMAAKVLPGNLLWVVEFDRDFPDLKLKSESVFRLKPPVQGV